jgi:hypothetical protein
MLLSVYEQDSALQPVFYLPGLIYKALTCARNGAYAAGLLPQHRLFCL